MITVTHNNDINEDFTKWSEWFSHVEEDAKTWALWHDYWIQKSINKEMPIYFFRYEDMITDPKSELSKIFAFSLGVPSVEGTVIEKQIIETVEGGSKKNMLYKPRQEGGGINKNRSRYTEEQIAYIKEHCAEALSMFGYTNNPTGEKNDCAFFDFADKNPHSASFEGFRQLNKEMIEYID